MSCHRVVRTNQEPTLVVADFHAVPFSLIQQFVERTANLMSFPD